MVDRALSAAGFVDVRRFGTPADRMICAAERLAQGAQSGHNLRYLMFVRFQSAEPSASGRHPGVFALANCLARDGVLTADEYDWWRTNNEWFENAYSNPGLVDPLIFDRTVHGRTACWFKQGSAAHLLARLDGYLALLDKYGVGWVRLASEDPGRIIYEDDVQIVVSLDG